MMGTMLNPQQRLAVEHGDGPLLILAGAGSGKTRVLTERMARLIGHHRIPPEAILAVTFTNKAAREMRIRLERTVGAMPGMWVTTFHSAGLRLLRKEAAHIGLARDFVVYDDDDQVKVIRAVLTALNLDERRVTPRGVMAQIGRAKDQLLGPEEVAPVAAGTYGEQFSRIYARYEEALQRAQAVDFADLLRLPVLLFRRAPEVLARYQAQFRHMLIDEYQDTNHAQYQLVRQLTAAHDNLCVVGDPDQSIYGWRGADIRNILSFERDFPRAVVVKLEQNYRSTRTILSAANAVIAKNRSRKPKDLWTDNAIGSPIHFRAHETDLHEAGWVAQTIHALRSDGRNCQEVAVFYRTNAQSRVLEEAFRRRGIPYVIFGGVRFYERREIKDLLAYLRLLVNPHDGVSLTRVLNTPPRGIGKSTIDRLVDIAAREGCSVSMVLERIADVPEFQSSTRKRLQEFHALLQPLRVLAGGDLVLLWERLLEESGYARWIADDEQAEDRLANIEELGRALLETPYDPTVPETPLQQFLDQVALVSDIDRFDEAGGAVALMTLHLAKGLEFPVVFLVGLEEGLFPHARTLDDDEGLEEERRLCYVGLTRAEEVLHLSYAQRRRLHGREQFSLPSRFLDEIPGECIAEIGQTVAPQRSPQSGHHQAMPIEEFDQRPVEEQADGWRAGYRVSHPVFGAGTICHTEGNGEKMKVTVQFDMAGRKTLMLAYANLRVG